MQLWEAGMQQPSLCIPQGVPICNVAASVLSIQIIVNTGQTSPDSPWGKVQYEGLSKKASGTEGGVCKLPVVGKTDTLRTNKAFKKKSIFIQEWWMNTKYANILTWLSAAKHLCLLVFGANVSFEWGMSVHTQILTRLPLTLCFSCVEGKLRTLAFAFPLLFFPPHFYSQKINPLKKWIGYFGEDSLELRQTDFKQQCLSGRRRARENREGRRGREWLLLPECKCASLVCGVHN